MTKRVLLLLCKGTELFEAAAFYDVIGWAQTHCGSIEAVTVAPTPVVECTFGLKIHADSPIAEIDPTHFDALAIPGGFEEFGFYDASYSTLVQTLISHFVEAGKPIATICVGALPLGKTGALEGKSATTYHLGDGKRRQQLAAFGARVLDRQIVQEGPFMTSTSPATAAEVAFRLVGILLGEASAQELRTLMGFTPEKIDGQS